MHFKFYFHETKLWLLSALFCATNLSCGVSPNNSSDGQIGDPILEVSPLYDSAGVESQKVFLTDDYTKRILKIDMATLSVDTAISMTNPDADHTILSPVDGRYLIDFSKKQLRVVSHGGVVTENPIKFAGTPQSASYQSNLGVLVVQDDLRSIGLMMLSPEGKVLKTFLGGSLIADNKSAFVGDIDASGRLILAASDKSIINVKVEASIDQASWSYSTFDSGITSINWLSPDVENPGLALVKSSDTMALIDYVNGTVKKTIKFSDAGVRYVSASRKQKPHIITVDTKTGLGKLNYISSSGELVTRDIPNYTTFGTVTSFMTKDLILNLRNDNKILKLRLSDNLALQLKEFNADGKVFVGLTKILVKRKSALGFLELLNIDDENRKQLSGFNLKYYQDSK